MITLGIDIGSAASKAVILENGTTILARQAVPLGTGTSGPSQVYEKVFQEAGLRPQDVSRSVVTGYGRMKFHLADEQISELSCHGKGVHVLAPGIRTVIDIGGQDVKALHIDEEGRLQEFVMNDKCAAGTGRFLEVMARTLNIRMEDMGPMAASSTKAVSISSTCTVFAESEVISQLSEGETISDIVAGIHRSVARRVAGMTLKIGCIPGIAMSGGVALNEGITRALQEELHMPIWVHPDCQLAGAIGAARLAWERNRSGGI